MRRQGGHWSRKNNPFTARRPSRGRTSRKHERSTASLSRKRRGKMDDAKNHDVESGTEENAGHSRCAEDVESQGTSRDSALRRRDSQGGNVPTSAVEKTWEETASCVELQTTSHQSVPNQRGGSARWSKEINAGASAITTWDEIKGPKTMSWKRRKVST